jgi:hypothetical protein
VLVGVDPPFEGGCGTAEPGDRVKARGIMRRRSATNPATRPNAWLAPIAVPRPGSGDVTE